jgi:hypothetical protein
MTLSVSVLYSVDDRMVNQYGAVGGMKIGMEGRSSGRKLAPVPPCSPQNPHDRKSCRTRTAAVGSRRLTARAMVRSVNDKLYKTPLLTYLLTYLWSWALLEKLPQNLICRGKFAPWLYSSDENQHVTCCQICQYFLRAWTFDSCLF